MTSQQAAPMTSVRLLNSRLSCRRIAIQAEADILKQTRTARIQGKAFHNAVLASLFLMTHRANGPRMAKNDRVTNTLALTTHSRPLIPMYRLCTSCFHVDATRAVSPSSTMAIARD